MGEMPSFQNPSSKQKTDFLICVRDHTHSLTRRSSASSSSCPLLDSVHVLCIAVPTRIIPSCRSLHTSSPLLDEGLTERGCVAGLLRMPRAADDGDRRSPRRVAYTGWTRGSKQSRRTICSARVRLDDLGMERKMLIQQGLVRELRCIGRSVGRDSGWSRGGGGRGGRGAGLQQAPPTERRSRRGRDGVPVDGRLRQLLWLDPGTDLFHLSRGQFPCDPEQKVLGVHESIPSSGLLLFQLSQLFPEFLEFVRIRCRRVTRTVKKDITEIQRLKDNKRKTRKERRF